MRVVRRARHPALALETTLLSHGVPRDDARALLADLADVCRARGVEPALCGVVGGRAIAGLSDDEARRLIDAEPTAPKLNTANLGVALHAGGDGATTVSTTVEIAAAAGIDVFATGGIGGVHRGYASRLDISADLAALARWPVAVVCSGVKAILDVTSSREALESLGVPVIGWRTDRFPAFYLHDSGARVDARLDDADDLARFLRAELARAGRGVLIVNPPPDDHALDADDFAGWLDETRRRVEGSGVTERDITPALLAALHELSRGATLRCNIALVRSNADLGAQLALRLSER